MKILEHKTFWSVAYSVLGDSYGPRTAWFDDKEKAIEFSQHDYRDDPIPHRFSNKGKISAAEFCVKHGYWPSKYDLMEGL